MSNSAFFSLSWAFTLLDKASCSCRPLVPHDGAVDGHFIFLLVSYFCLQFQWLKIKSQIITLKFPSSSSSKSKSEFVAELQMEKMMTGCRLRPDCLTSPASSPPSSCPARDRIITESDRTVIKDSFERKLGLDGAKVRHRWRRWWRRRLAWDDQKNLCFAEITLELTKKLNKMDLW